MYNNHQIISKNRVVDHGEVFTSEREVNAMLDLVKNETERIESRFLEPACGTGNFLVEILNRKLSVVENKYKKSQSEYERYAVLALSSIYGIDLLEDNVESCRNRLFQITEEKYSALYKTTIKREFLDTIQYILEQNVICGDALTLKTVGDNPQPIIFSEWSPLNGSMLKRRDFAFHNLISHQEIAAMPLFSDLGEDVFIPQPIKEYPAVHFLKVKDA